MRKQMGEYSCPLRGRAGDVEQLHLGGIATFNTRQRIASDRVMASPYELMKNRLLKDCVHDFSSDGEHLKLLPFEIRRCLLLPTGYGSSFRKLSIFFCGSAVHQSILSEPPPSPTGHSYHDRSHLLITTVALKARLQSFAVGGRCADYLRLVLLMLNSQLSHNPLTNLDSSSAADWLCFQGIRTH